MRIGLIAPPWIPVPPPAYGGIEAVMDTLAVALTDAGHEVLLAASGDSTCPVQRIPGFPESNPALVGTTLPELRQVTRAYAALTDVDVIHDHTVVGPRYPHHPPGIPVVATVHGPFLPEVIELYRRVPSEVAIVAISRNQASAADGVRVARVIHHGIDPARVPVGEGRGGYACFLGRMNPDKGAREAILIARRAGVPLVIAARVQEPAEREYFGAVIRPLLGADTEFVGELHAREKYALLGGAVALLNPIQWDEPFGMVMIESLATGTPVVVTPRGSAPEIIDDGRTGFLRTRADELADALAHAGELDRRLCRLAVEGRFSAARMAADHLDLYSGLLRHGAGIGRA